MFHSSKPASQLLTSFYLLNKSSMKNPRSLEITSEIFDNLSIHIDDVELLQNAFVAQAITGPLVRFSNRGRYEPYIAKNWSQSGNDWIFELNPELKCEDGQPINAVSFKNSLMRSFKRFSLEEIKQTPFRYLKGIEPFLARNDSSPLGIEADSEKLILKFSKQTGKALLEYLAMTPFAFLCEANFELDSWNKRGKFISSGPYRISSFDSSKNTCSLALRKEWVLNSTSEPIFEEILLTKNATKDRSFTSKIEMTYANPKGSNNNFTSVFEVPRALISVRVGVEKGQFFSSIARRRTLQSKINKILDRASVPFENYHRATSFFFGQVTGHETQTSFVPDLTKPLQPLRIRGQKPGTRPEADFYQSILIAALSELDWPFEFIDRPIQNVDEFHNSIYDLAFDRSHVDATLDPDFVRILFQSKLGPKFQDPNGKIANLVENFDKGSVTYREFLVEFNQAISDDAAIIPMFHRGFVWRFSKNIESKQISPLMSILRFEELRLIANE